MRSGGHGTARKFAHLLTGDVKDRKARRAGYGQSELDGGGGIERIGMVPLDGERRRSRGGIIVPVVKNRYRW